MKLGFFIMPVHPTGRDYAQVLTEDRDRNDMLVEAMDHVLALWASDPPYDLPGKYWTISTQRTTFGDQGGIPKPYQKPHPPIVVTVVAPHSKGVTQAAARGWEPVSANFLLPQWVRSHWPSYVE